MSRRALAAVLALSAAAALGAVAATFVLGARLFEPTVARDPGEAGLRWGSARKGSAAGAGDGPCAISAGPCERAGPGDLAVRLEVRPRPVRAMADLTFVVSARRGGLPLVDAEAEIALSMPGMYMGENRIRLAGLGGGVYQGKGVIVRCPSGRRLWSAEIALRPREPAAAAPLRTAFTFEVAE